MKKTPTPYSRYFETPRCEGNYQPVTERLRHFGEFRIPLTSPAISEQGNRCMTCGIPFCHNAGCPLGNPIPEANALVRDNRWKEASDLFHAYNNFPEFTGRLCPALCEASCVHYINDDAVTIRQIELEIVERAWREGWIKPSVPQTKTGKRVAVIGSGPAGLAAAQQLARAGYDVVLYEKDDLPGGILRYGIPDFKLEKSVLDRRLEQMQAEGVSFETNVKIGEDVSPLYLKRQFDAVVLTGGAMEPRNLDVPGREAKGIYFAMDYLMASNYAVRENRRSTIDADGLKVITLGGGDTGADCLGTALRQGASSVLQLEIMPKPPEGKNEATPWPRWPVISRTGTSHKEGGDRRWNVSTKRFLTEKGRVIGIEGIEVDWSTGKPVEKPGTEFKQPADIVLLALGFVHPKQDALLEMLGVELDARKNVKVNPETMMTSVPGIFSAGDMQSGASLVVRCIAGGRQAAYNVDKYLTGSSNLPKIEPTPSWR
ncbi:MAG: glutamate synthase subunit beta [Planctomycetaceae bacterium]|jgi:glutamate synthase (NADPH/NADH) small chain|nr:glutamate synthase subunit beta [Planctomycetaceae bacterium]